MPTAPRADPTAAHPAEPAVPSDGSGASSSGAARGAGAAPRDWADLGSLVGLGVLALLVGEVGGVTTCPLAGLLGVPCPGCGLTRATWALVTGHVAEAIALHPFVLLAVPALGAALLSLAARRVVPRSSWLAAPRLARGAERGAVAVALAMVALWLARFLGACGGPVAVDPWFR
ncbi:MAG TPA: DUF2752 domain-containing protein [Polyangiaceae bacterium]|nr:DUF2752 domain-containing protein [Polyangiaceae bacterium]